MKIKTSELTDKTLDWAAGKAAGPESIASAYFDDDGLPIYLDEAVDQTWSPSTNWNQAGPLIEQSIVSIDKQDDGDSWAAFAWCSDRDLQRSVGPTLLVAAMRCLVASKLGSLVDVPDELLNSEKSQVNDESGGLSLPVLSIAEMKSALESHDYFVGVRHTSVKPEFAGKFMVKDMIYPYEDGYAIVGDDLDELVTEAYKHLINDDENDASGVKS